MNILRYKYIMMHITRMLVAWNTQWLRDKCIWLRSPFLSENSHLYMCLRMYVCIWSVVVIIAVMCHMILDEYKSSWTILVIFFWIILLYQNWNRIVAVKQKVSGLIRAPDKSFFFRNSTESGIVSGRHVIIGDDWILYLILCNST